MATHEIEKMGAIVLAAGQSKRMPGINKLLEKLAGRTLISHVLTTLSDLHLAKVVVVTRPPSDEMNRIVASHGFDIAVNQKSISGMGTSLATGAAHVPKSLTGCFIVLADMPFVKPQTFFALATAMLDNHTPSTAITIPVKSGRRGHPVLFGPDWFTQLQSLSGDQGARKFIDETPERIISVEVADSGIFEDIDTANELANAASRIKT